MLDRAEAEKLYAVEGVTEDEALDLKQRAKLDGWNAHPSEMPDGRYKVEVFGPRPTDWGYPDPDPAA